MTLQLAKELSVSTERSLPIWIFSFARKQTSNGFISWKEYERRAEFKSTIRVNIITITTRAVSNIRIGVE